MQGLDPNTRPVRRRRNRKRSEAEKNRELSGKQEYPNPVLTGAATVLVSGLGADEPF